MKARKYVGATSREVLRQVRQDLGEDALVLSSRAVEGGMELLAVPASALTVGTGPAAPVSQASSAGAIPGESASGILSEIRDMRALLQRELSALNCSEQLRSKPVYAALLRDLLAAGFSALLARRLAEAGAASATPEQGMQRIVAALAHGMPTTDRDDAAVRGGVYALVGPTGVGKTTTVAKLAARAVVRHGASSVALLTTDSYRIAAHDQLRVFGRILGVPVHAVKDGQDLRLLLDDLSGKHLILIDTIGMSQRDRMVPEQAALLAASGGAVKRLLLLNATCATATLDEVVEAYRRGGVDGCIITKADEAANLGTVVDAAVRHELAIHYVTTGQRVPEDLHLPNRNYLAHRALKLNAAAAAAALHPEECPLVFSIPGVPPAEVQSA